jgi:hypothetical protein
MANVVRNANHTGNAGSINMAQNQAEKASGAILSLITGVVQSNVLAQALYAAILVGCVYLILVFVEVVWNRMNRLQLNRTELIPNTCPTDVRTKIIAQNPNVAGSKPIALSSNERSGIEFCYSFFLNVNPSSFRQEQGLLHVFHKGYSSQFPLLAPGVYVRSDTNTLRIYMNTYRTWNNYVEVDNFPISKWVHVVLCCQENALDIFINGNLSKRHSFEGFIPYQNDQDIICFSQRQLKLDHSHVPSVDKDGFQVYGAMKGYLSRLIYFNYALSYSEIQQLLSQGPSPSMDSEIMDSSASPYLDDTWWTQNQ